MTALSEALAHGKVPEAQALSTFPGQLKVLMVQQSTNISPSSWATLHSIMLKQQCWLAESPMGGGKFAESSMTFPGTVPPRRKGTFSLKATSPTAEWTLCPHAEPSLARDVRNGLKANIGRCLPTSSAACSLKETA